MVGKIKHVRQKLHQQAVRVDGPTGVSSPPGSAPSLEKAPRPAESPVASALFDPSVHKPVRLPQPAKTDGPKDKTQASSFPSGIFAGTHIAPEALVQTLKFEEPSEPAVKPPDKKGPEEKRVKSKKDKLKERRERWLSKIHSIKQQREQQAAQAKRQAMPVVGDMRPLADALPELSQLLSPTAHGHAAAPRHKNRKNRVPVKKKPEPTDFSLMKQSQKRKLLETETNRFGEEVKNLASKSNPLADIGEHLRKRMRQEEEQGPS